MKIVPDEKWDSSIEQFIRSKIWEVMGKNVEVYINIVSEIESTKHGKSRFTISKL